MSADYIDLYRSVGRRRRAFRPASRGRTGIFPARVAIAAKSAYPVVSPGAFTPVAAPPVLFGQSVEYEWVEPLDLIRSRLEDFDAVLVGRNAVGGGQVGHQSEACKKLNISVLLDLDDDELQPRSQTHNGHPRS